MRFSEERLDEGVVTTSPAGVNRRLHRGRVWPRQSRNARLSPAPRSEITRSAHSPVLRRLADSAVGPAEILGESDQTSPGGAIGEPRPRYVGRDQSRRQGLGEQERSGRTRAETAVRIAGLGAAVALADAHHASVVEQKVQWCAPPVSRESSRARAAWLAGRPHPLPAR